MSDNDWINLRKLLVSYGNQWLDISAENAGVVCQKKFNGEDLFEFLMRNDYFYFADLISVFIPLFEDYNIELIHEVHHKKYADIITQLSTDQLILLYEDYSSDSDYRISISKRYEKVLLGISNPDHIVELIDEHNFLFDLNPFCEFLKKINSESVINFCKLYSTYIDLQAVVNRLINEYYLEYVKYQIRIITGMSMNQSVVLYQHYETLHNIIQTMPKKFIDYNYVDSEGRNILMYLAKIPFLSESDKDIYTCAFNNIDTIVINKADNDGNTILHFVAAAGNKIYFDTIIEWFLNDSSMYYASHKLNQLLEITNNDNISIYDLLLQDSTVLLFSILHLLPLNIHKAVVNKIVSTPDMINSIPVDENSDRLLFDVADSLMHELVALKKSVLFSINDYDRYRSCMVSAVKKIKGSSGMDDNFLVEMLFSCLLTDDPEIFTMITNLYTRFYSKNEILISLNKISTIHKEPIIINAIRNDRIPFIKLLLAHDVDLLVCDEYGKNAFIIALEKQSLYTIRVVRAHIESVNKYSNMKLLLDRYIELLQRDDSFDFTFVNKFFIKLLNLFHLKN